MASQKIEEKVGKRWIVKKGPLEDLRVVNPFAECIGSFLLRVMAISDPGYTKKGFHPEESGGELACERRFHSYIDSYQSLGSWPY